MDLKARNYNIAKEMIEGVEDEEKKALLETLCSFDASQGSPGITKAEVCNRCNFKIQILHYSAIQSIVYSC